MVIIYSVDGSPYLDWQSRLLQWSARQAGHRGLVMPILHSDPLAPSYIAINKPAGMVRIIDTLASDVLIIDTDFLMVRACDDLKVTAGEPYGQVSGYLDATRMAGALDQYIDKPMQDVGVPLLLHKEDAATILPLWYSITREMLRDPETVQRLGWPLEMWAYCVAAARLGLRHKIWSPARISGMRLTDARFINYTFGVQAAGWDKRKWSPYARIAQPEALTSADRFTIRTINAWLNVIDPKGRPPTPLNNRILKFWR